MVGSENERTKRIRKFTMRQVSVVFSKCGVQSKRQCERHGSCVCVVGFSACVCQKKSVVYETCRVDMWQFREVSRTRTVYSTETRTSDFILNTFSNVKPKQFVYFPGEVHV